MPFYATHIAPAMHRLYQWLKPQYRLDHQITFRSYIEALLITAFAGGVVAVLEYLTEERFSNLSVGFLIPVLYNTIQYGVRCALVSSIFALFIFDYFFLPPFFSTLNYSSDNLIKFLTFIAAILITHVLAGEIRHRGIALERDKRHISLMLLISEQLASIYDKDAIIYASEKLIAEAMGVPARIVTHTPMLEEMYLQFPIRSGKRVYGTLVLGKPQPGHDASDFSMLAELIASHLATHIERGLLHQEKEAALLQVERETIRNALLTSLSHDLKTPLAGIIGAITTLTLSKDGLTSAQEQTLIRTISTESERMSGFVTNLLNVTRLESGAIQPNARWVDIEDILDRAMKFLHEKLQHYHVNAAIAADVPALFVDPLLMEQVLINLLDNACKYAPHGSSLWIRVYRHEGQLLIEVEDEGTGIPYADLERIFDKFFRLEHQDKHIAGTGLGLFIARGMVELSGGSISAVPPDKLAGALLRIEFPAHLLETITPPPEEGEHP